jgi:hypothetical protein
MSLMAHVAEPSVTEINESDFLRPSCVSMEQDLGINGCRGKFFKSAFLSIPHSNDFKTRKEFTGRVDISSHERGGVL